MEHENIFLIMNISWGENSGHMIIMQGAPKL